MCKLDQTEKILEQIKSADHAVDFFTSEICDAMEEMKDFMNHATSYEIVRGDFDPMVKRIKAAFNRRKCYEELGRVLRSLVD